MMHKKLRHVATAAAVALSLTGWMTSASAADIKVGLLVSLTGTNAVVGEDISRAIRLATQRINAGYEVPQKDGSSVTLSPETLGGKIELIIEDSESRPAAALDAMRKLVNVNKVPAVLGVMSSGVCVPTGQFAQQAEVVQICTSTSPEVRNIGSYVFSVMGLDDLMGQAIADFAHEDGNTQKAASLTPNNPFGVGMEIQACQQLESLGAECITKVRYEQEKSDYNADLRRTVSQNPDGVIFTAYGSDARLLLQQAYEQGIDVASNWYADYPSLWITDVEKIPQVAEGIRGLEPGSDGPAVQAYSAAYEEAYGEKPTSVFGSYMYDAAVLLALAINKAGASTPEAIRDALGPVSETYDGVTGDKAFDADGMQTSEAYHPVIIRDGEMVPYEK